MNPPRSRACVVWLLCLGLLVPGVGRAAQDVPDPLPGTQSDVPRRLLVDGWEQEEGQTRPGAPVGLRVLGEVGGALLTSAALGSLVGLSTGLLCLVTPPLGEYDGLTCLALGLLGASVGAGIGLPLGTWWAGELLGGNGSLLASLTGMALGAGSGVLVFVLTTSATSHTTQSELLAGVSIPVLALAGSLLGYELFQQTPRRWASRGGLQPLLSFTPNGPVMGLGGHF